MRRNDHNPALYRNVENHLVELDGLEAYFDEIAAILRGAQGSIDLTVGQCQVSEMAAYNLEVVSAALKYALMLVGEKLYPHVENPMLYQEVPHV